MRWTTFFLLVLSASAVLFGQTPAGTVGTAPSLPHPVLDRILATRTLNCGVAKEEEDYSRAEDHGNRAAFDVDLCRAIAVAVLGPGAKLVIKPWPDEPGALKALASGEVDVVATASPTVANTARGFVFTSPVLLDGQTFLVPKEAGVKTPLDLAGKKVCFLTGSTAETGLHAYAERHGITYIWYPFSEAGEMEAAFFTGNCNAISSDLLQLGNIRAIDRGRAAEFSILPEIIREDPLAPAVLGSDTRFAAIVFWTVQALVEAERLGLTQASAAAAGTAAVAPASVSPEVQQLLGQRYGTGSLLGLDPHWARNAIAAAGNYGEIFDRDLGPASRLRLDRGENRLWTQGGQIYGILPSDW